MVFHKDRTLPRGGFVQCHHCQAEQRLPLTCPDCNRRVIKLGLGTQRVEEELRRKFAALRSDGALVRVDSDTMHSAHDFHDVLERFGRGAIRLLVGTQMIAKGLDFPGVRLVGVVNADTAINMPDFRATERTFQLVSQVAGRCGRSTAPDAGGEVIVQSLNPEVPAIQLAAAHDFRRFAELELEARRHGAWPPWTRLARIIVRDVDAVACAAEALRVAEGLRALAADDLRVLGPQPCVIARIAGRHRHEVLLVARNAAELQAALAAARNRDLIRPGAAVAIDVDPVALM
jgi:primosomal protein N' (replication factor Y)